MAFDRDKLEIDRLANLVIGFGWTIAKSDFTDDKIKVELTKPRTEGTTTPEAGAG